MEDMALKTLFYGLEQCGAKNSGRGLFVNACYHADIPEDTLCVQWFEPYSRAIVGFDSLQSIEEVRMAFDRAYILIPKNAVEARYLIARSLQLLKPGAPLYCVAENKAGGSRLQKMVQQFSGEIVQQISKHKSRFVQIENKNINADEVEKALREGCLQRIEKTGFISQSGIYGWNKIDKGSALLLQHIPQDIKGRIADFGCGYGYMLQHVLQHNDLIKAAYAIDADVRALECARQNIGGERVEYLWADLTQGTGVPARLDTIIMNPPFHEGKKTDSDIGASFIQTAAQCLKRNGVLYMVANNQLPYETVLDDAFFTVELLAQENGFKVFKATA